MFSLSCLSWYKTPWRCIYLNYMTTFYWSKQARIKYPVFKSSNYKILPICAVLWRKEVMKHCSVFGKFMFILQWIVTRNFISFHSFFILILSFLLTIALNGVWGVYGFVNVLATSWGQVSSLQSCTLSQRTVVSAPYK